MMVRAKNKHVILDININILSLYSKCNYNIKVNSSDEKKIVS
jgi:hypothetical protein